MGEKVNRAAVFEVLKYNRTKVTKDPDSDDPNMFILEKGELLESIAIPREVDSKLLQYFKRKYGCGIHEFYNPGHFLQ